MPILEHFMIGGLASTIAFYTLLLIAITVIILKWARISVFLGEVKSELRKANWPWETDPKIKGLKKYKELVDSTVVVLIAMILLAGFVQFWDFFHVLIVGFFTNLGR